MARSPDTIFKAPRKAESPSRDVAFVFILVTLAWAATSCASASVHEACSKPKAWDLFGSYEDCMAAKGDPEKISSEDEIAVSQRR